MEVSEFFSGFIKTKWDDKCAYDLGDFVDKYGMRYNVAAYYLQKYVKAGELICLKVRNKTYYMKPEWKPLMKKLVRVSWIKFR